LLLMYPFLFFWAYGPTLRKEETFLGSTFGQAYFQHMLETPQVLTDGESLKNWRHALRGFSKQRITPKEVARLSRFWGIAFLLVFVQELGKKALLEIHSFSHLASLNGWRYLALSLLFFAASLVILRTRKKLKPDSPLCQGPQG
jgi:hypothetical protein